MEFRSFYKPAGTNPEIEGPFYELSSYIDIEGHFNLESLTLGFKKGSSLSEMTFRPIDPTKPIVLAVDTQTSIGFIYIDQHLQESEAGMYNYKIFKTDAFLIDCQRWNSSGRNPAKEYWSVKSEGMTFVYSETLFPDTWHLPDCDLLCALVAGDLTANQLRMFAYLTAKEESKEVRREEHLRRFAKEIGDMKEEASRLFSEILLEKIMTDLRYELLKERLSGLLLSWWPFVSKKALRLVTIEHA